MNVQLGFISVTRMLTVIIQLVASLVIVEMDFLAMEWNVQVILGICDFMPTAYH